MLATLVEAERFPRWSASIEFPPNHGSLGSDGWPPCIGGLRIPVASVVGMVANGMSEPEIVAAYRYLEVEAVREAIRCAPEAVREGELPANRNKLLNAATTAVDRRLSGRHGAAALLRRPLDLRPVLRRAALRSTRQRDCGPAPGLRTDRAYAPRPAGVVLLRGGCVSARGPCTSWY